MVVPECAGSIGGVKFGRVCPFVCGNITDRQQTFSIKVHLIEPLVHIPRLAEHPRFGYVVLIAYVDFLDQLVGRKNRLSTGAPKKKPRR